MSNARNLANLLGTNTTIQTANLADSAVSTAKLADSAVTSAKLPTGSVVQVVSSSNTSSGGFTYTSFTDRHTATITPQSSSNKILVIINNDYYNGGTGNRGLQWQLIDHDGSEALNSFYNLRDDNTYYKAGTTGANFLSSPATTSAVTYKIKDKAIASSPTFRSCTITLMEIVA